MKERNQARPEVPQRTVNYHGLSHFEVFLLILWGVALEFGYVTLWYSLPNYASSTGLNPQQGSVAGAIMNLGLVIGRPIVGYASDTFGRSTISMVMTALCGLLCFAI
jgi:MFS family permease